MSKGRSLTIETLEVHAAGEPLRLVISGFPRLPGRTILAKRRFARRHLDHLRMALIGEPRGHSDMYGAVLTEPERPASDLGVLFLHNEGYSTMCGHGIIALVTAVLEAGLVKRKGLRPTVRIDTPAGLVVAAARLVRGRVEEVSFRNVPSFVLASGVEIAPAGLPRITCDLAFGGAFYAFCRAEDLGFRLVPDEFRALIDAGMRVKEAAASAVAVRHPVQADLGFLYGTILVGPPADPRHHSRNVCVFARGEVDRSPTGTGVSARAALHYFQGDIGLGEPFVVESLIGTCFTGRALEETRCGPFPAVIPEVSGRAAIVGRSKWTIDPRDPLRDGFFLR